jgi:hypothetical protein
MERLKLRKVDQMRNRINRGQGGTILALLLSAGIATAQTHPRTLLIVPVGGTDIGGPLTVEVFLSNVSSSDQYYSRAKVDVPCVITGGKGTAGTLSVSEITQDSDADGVLGPSAKGVPHLITNGLGGTGVVHCSATIVPAIGDGPALLAPEKLGIW